MRHMMEPKCQTDIIIADKPRPTLSERPNLINISTTAKYEIHQRE